ncbi:MAG: hypothetical protein GVY09_14605, partial [Gammaproteobacteria bacterium]|nr:hypothetical protein [Gammaproteobacteria bacterium]
MWRDKVTVPAILVAAVLAAGCGRQSTPPAAPSLVELTIDGAHAALSQGRVSCEGLTRGYLVRIQTFDPPPVPGADAEQPPPLTQAPAAPEAADNAPIGRLEVPVSPADALNAIIAVNPKALDRARALDAEQARLGRLRTLHCMPVILKDNFDTADMPTEAGSAALAGTVPPDDAFMVHQLRTAGAIVLAKANMGEWAFRS